MQYAGKAMTAAHSLLLSVAAMALLQLVMTVALFATRIPALIQARVPPQRIDRAVLDRLPKWTANIADNYRNLFEAPTAFYAIALAIVLLGQADSLYAVCAWTYVAARVVHSAVQSTVNHVLTRFAIFAASCGVLGVMIIRCIATQL